MLTLVTSNTAKYKPFAQDLERLRIKLEPPKQSLPELQGLSFAEGLEAKARAAAQMFGSPVLVDDSGLILEAYQPFPGPLTSTVVRSLGVEGLRRLLAGVSARATMECHIGTWLSGKMLTWSGKVHGRLDFDRTPKDSRMILSDLFVPDSTEPGPLLLHRREALAALSADVFRLHLDMESSKDTPSVACADDSSFQCPFCVEFEGDPSSLFARAVGGRLNSRVVYEDEHFVVIPPIGEFVPGGLLLLTREHIPCFAWLEPGLFPHLERLLRGISKAVIERWGVPLLIFEHGPALDRSKGVCCVDHAHLNIFPATVHVRPHLASRMSMAMPDLAQMSKLRRAEFGYLFVQENDGTRSAYDAQYVPTQLVRRIITKELGMADRWHWQDYPGIDELVATYDLMKGTIRL